jgi:hypothetical protein
VPGWTCNLSLIEFPQFGGSFRDVTIQSGSPASRSTLASLTTTSRTGRKPTRRRAATSSGTGSPTCAALLGAIGRTLADDADALHRLARNNFYAYRVLMNPTHLSRLSGVGRAGAGQRGQGICGSDDQKPCADHRLCRQGDRRQGSARRTILRRRVEHVMRGRWSALEREARLKELCENDLRTCPDYRVWVEQEPVRRHWLLRPSCQSAASARQTANHKISAADLG